MIRDEINVFIPYINDSINEADEGFFVVLEIDDNLTSAAIVNETMFDMEGVALMEITDDDSK